MVQCPLFRYFCISFGNQSPRVWRKSGETQNHVALSPVWSIHSQWWFGLPCHLLVLVHCVFWSPQSTQPSMLPSADKLYGDAEFIFQQNLAPAHTAKGTKSLFNDHGINVLDWPANLPDLNPIDNLWGIVKRKMRDAIPNNADDLNGQSNMGFITPERCHGLIASMPRRIDAVIHAKGGPIKYWVHNVHTFQKPDISV